jgi:DnaK suppressor protein
MRLSATAARSSVRQRCPPNECIDFLGLVHAKTEGMVMADQVFFWILEEIMQDVRTMRTTLEYELAEIRTQIAELQETFRERPGYGLGRGNPAAIRREVSRALLRRLRERAGSLEQAMSRLAEGSYGICIQCGKPIHPERLAVLPDTEICIDCAQRN